MMNIRLIFLDGSELRISKETAQSVRHAQEKAVEKTLKIEAMEDGVTQSHTITLGYVLRSTKVTP